MNNELKQIKKKYGERMMHLCRELFPTIINDEGKLINILDSTFGHPKYLYDDIIDQNCVTEFKNFIYNLYDDNYVRYESNKTPFELMDEAGYTLYECHTNDEIMAFKKYYSSGEKLCTFKDKRLKNYHVFFAVKKNVDDIKREDFKNPKRQDEYGISVISIQFSRGSVNTLSIKNRYNHTVSSPDATFSNNLDNIIEGLTDSFEKVYNLNINYIEDNSLELDNYVLANDRKYYKYNMECNLVNYCPDNIIIDEHNVIKDYQEKEKYIIMDRYILDLENKEVMVYDEELERDAFLDGLSDIKKININKINNNKLVEIIPEDGESIFIKLDKDNCIIGYSNSNLTKIKHEFMGDSKKLKYLSLPNVLEIGRQFLYNNKSLQELSLPRVEKIGYSFLYYNEELSKISLPCVKEVSQSFLAHNKNLKEIDFPKMIKIDDYFLNNNNIIEKVLLPCVEKIGRNFLFSTKYLTVISLPCVRTIDEYFIFSNEIINAVDLPQCKTIGSQFLAKNKKLEAIALPRVERIYSAFLHENKVLNYLYMPNLREVSARFLCSNNSLKNLYLPSLSYVGPKFLANNEVLENVYLPNLNNTLFKLCDNLQDNNKILKLKRYLRI